MKKRSLMSKILGHEESQDLPSSVTFERRPPTAAQAQGQSISRSGRRATDGDATRLEDRDDMAGIMDNLPPATSAKLNELNRAKTDLAQMEAEMAKSQRMFKLANDRIGELSRYLSHSEVDLATLERLTPENERLVTRSNELKSELTREKALTAESEARAVAIESKYFEAQKANELHRQDALTLKETIRSLKQSIDSKSKEVSELTATLDDMRDKLDLERDNATVLAEKNSRIVAEMSTVSRKNLELEKRVEEIHASNKRNAKEREAAQIELKSLRLEFGTLRDSAIDKAARLESLQNELSIKERNFDENIKYRENEVFGLQSSIEDYQVQLRIKEDVSRRADRELIDLKTMMAEETKRRRRLEKELDDQSKQLEQNRQALVQARQNFDDLNRRLVDAQSELRAVKVVNQQQAIKLEQYSAVGGVVVDFKKEADDIARRREARIEAGSKATEIAASEEAAIKAQKDEGVSKTG